MARDDYGFLTVENGRVLCPYCTFSVSTERNTETGDPLIHHIQQAKGHPYNRYKTIKSDLKAKDLKPHPGQPETQTQNAAEGAAQGAQAGPATPSGAGEGAGTAGADAAADGADGVADGGTETETEDVGTGVKLTQDAPQGNPLLRQPVMATDGGEDGCPDCDGDLQTVAEGWELQLRHRGDQRNEDEPPFVGEADGNEEYCADCDVIILEDGTAYDIVGVK